MSPGGAKLDPGAVVASTTGGDVVVGEVEGCAAAAAGLNGGGGGHEVGGTIVGNQASMRIARLDGHDVDFSTAAQLFAKEGKNDPCEVGSTSCTSDDDIGIVVRHLHLLHRFLADNGLVQQHMVEHGAERVFGVVAARRAPEAARS